MNRRVLIIVAVVLILISIVGIAVVAFLPGGLFTPTDASTPDPNATNGQTQPNGEVVVVTATPVYIMGAAQDIQRGQIIPTEALFAYPWPADSLPISAITDTMQVVGSRARYAIARGEPIFSTMVITSLKFLPDFGSDAAVQIAAMAPPGYVAISMPYDKRNGAALSIRDGDSVNVIVSFLLVDIDQEFQTTLPNRTTVLRPATLNPDGSLTEGTASISQDNDPSLLSAAAVVQSKQEVFGRPETQGEFSFYVVPSDSQRGRLVSQAIIQNARVLRLGQFQDIQPVIITATPSPVPPEQQEGSTPPPSPPPPTSTPEPDIITLLVSPQDALVIDYINRVREAYPGAVKITFALRAPGDTSLAQTESVTLQYMFQRYTISLPAKLDYGLDKTGPASTPATTP